MYALARRALKVFILANLVSIGLQSGLITAKADVKTSDGTDPYAVFSTPTVNTMQSTGAGAVSIPIQVPPGRAGIQPHLSLTYNSFDKNGWMGMGWHIPVSTIQRSTKRGVAYSNTNGFDFVADGVELIPTSNVDQFGGGTYLARIEGRYDRYEFEPGSGWVVTSLDGKKMYYGSEYISRQNDPADPERVFCWCLDKVVDPNGNYMKFAYLKDQGQIYLKQIDYTGNEDASTALEPGNSVIFHLEDGRPDQIRIFKTNFEVITAKRLRSIEVRSQDELMCAYQLEYDVSDATARSRLVRLQLYGSDALINSDGQVESGSLLPETVFTWESGEDRFDSQQTWIDKFGYDTDGWRLDRHIRMMADVNGDGMDDVVGFADYGVVVSLSTGSGFTAQQTWIDYFGYEAGSWRLDRHIRTMADVNGDGMADVVGFADFGVVVSLSTGSGFTAPQTWIDYFGYEAGSWRLDRHVRMMADVNGDGMADVVGFADFGVVVSLSTGSGFTAPQTWIDYFGYEAGSWRPDRHIRTMADVNGDGMADVVGFADFGVVVSLSTGSGFTTQQTWIDYFGYEAGSWRLDRHFRTMTDVNGDGLSDVVGFADFGVVVSLSTGSGFTAQQTWINKFGPEADGWQLDRHIRTMTDVNGDGMSDVVGFADYGVVVSLSTGRRFAAQQTWINKFGHETESWQLDRHIRTMADVNGDGLSDVVGFADYGVVVSASCSARGHLIETVKTSLGATTTMEYANSSEYENTLLPFVVHPVRKTSTNDGNGMSSEVNYTYEGGYFDFAEREFRGFKTVTRIYSNDTMNKVVYYQGNPEQNQSDPEDDDPEDNYFLKSRVRFVETWERSAANNDSLISRTDFTYSLRDESDGRQFVYLEEKISREYDNGQIVLETHEDPISYDEVGYLEKVEIWDAANTAEKMIMTFVHSNLGSASEPRWRKTMEMVEGEPSAEGSGGFRQKWYRYTNDGRANLEEKELGNDQGVSPVYGYAYDEYGNLEKRWDARSNPQTDPPTVFYEYDTATATFPVKVTNALGHTIEIGWAARFGKKSWAIDANGVRNDFQYDVFGRLVQAELTDQQGSLVGRTISEYHLDEIPRYVKKRMLESENPESYIDVYHYVDGLGRTIQTLSMGIQNGHLTPVVTRAFYDNMGRIEESWGPYFGDAINYPSNPIDGAVPKTWAEFDLRSRPIFVHTRDSQYGTLTIRNDYDGLATTTTGADGSKKTSIKDHLGRVTETIEYSDTAELHTQYEYNPAGDLIKVTDPLGHESTMDYDSLGRKINMVDPDMGYWQYGYDANGNLIWQKDAKNQEMEFSYDVLNRITLKRYLNPGPDDHNVYYQYDDATITLTNPIGRLSSFTNSVATTTYVNYDALGNATSVAKTISGDNQARTTEYGFDLAGRLSATVYPDNYQVNYNYYPGTGLLQNVMGITDLTAYVTYSDYPANGKIKKAVFGNAVETTYGYDPLSTRLTQMETGLAGSSPIIDRSYTYTKGGDIESIDDAVSGNTRYYEYDSLHRLINESSSVDEYTYLKASVLGYRYDQAKPLHGVGSIDNHNELWNVTYDANGNMTTGPDLSNPANPGARTITYNMDNMPVTISHSVNGSTRIDYDGNGRRVRKTGGGTTGYYFGAHFEIINGQAVKYIFAGNQRVAMIGSSGTFYFHKDHLGSSIVMTNETTGDVEQKGDYLPFGGQRGSSAITMTNYGFTDQEKDTETGLYNYNARLYDPAIALFITPDTIVSNAGSSQKFNRYIYCVNNPLNYVDPSGYKTDLWDDFRNSYDPLRIYKNGGFTGLVMYYQDPVLSSFTYTHEGGFGTSGGYTYGLLSFGGRWQERGSNAGLDGYIGLGYNYRDFKIGIYLWHNTHGDYTVGASVRYKYIYVKYGYEDINGNSGWNAGVGYKNNGTDVSVSYNSKGEWSLKGKYKYNDDVAFNGSYNITTGDYSAEAAYSGIDYFTIDASYSSKGGYSIAGMGEEESLYVSAAAIMAYSIYGTIADDFKLDDAKDYVKEKERHIRGWSLNQGILDTENMQGKWDKIEPIYKRFGYKR